MGTHNFYDFLGGHEPPWFLNVLGLKPKFSHEFWGSQDPHNDGSQFRWDIHLQHKEFRPSDAGFPNLRDV